MDVLNGVVVHARGGDRREYRPFTTSRVTNNPDPLAVVAAFRETFGFEEFYLADLDAITTSRGRSKVLARVVESGVKVLADLGLEDQSHDEPLFEPTANVSLILATECLKGPESLRRLIAANPARSLIFGLDLREGKPLVPPAADWGADSPSDLVKLVASLGISRFLLLDLSRVGTFEGSALLDVVKGIVQLDASLEILVGGGIAGIEEVLHWREEGVAGVLVGSALHGGRILPDDLKRLNS